MIAGPVTGKWHDGQGRPPGHSDTMIEQLRVLEDEARRIRCVYIRTVHASEQTVSGHNRERTHNQVHGFCFHPGGWRRFFIRQDWVVTPEPNFSSRHGDSASGERSVSARWKQKVQRRENKALSIRLRCKQGLDRWEKPRCGYNVV